jgi:hypothetical protein
MRYRRYLPFLGLVVALVSASTSQAAGVGISVGVLLLIVLRRMLMAPQWLFPRLRAQRRTTIAGPSWG